MVVRLAGHKLAKGAWVLLVLPLVEGKRRGSKENDKGEERQKGYAYIYRSGDLIIEIRVSL